MSSGRTASEDFAFVEPEPEPDPSNASGPLSSAGAGLGKGEGGGEGASSICACYCHLCVLFLFLFSFAFLTQPFFLQSLLAKLSIPGSLSGQFGLGQRSQPFWPFELPLKLFSRVPANAPRRAFSFCYLCI